MAKKKSLKKGKKNKKVEKKRTWKVWMTILCVFLGVSTIAGGVVLGVFLTGGFEEKIISPESISFGHDENTYLEVEDNFQLTITTPTEEVTQKKVTLYFDKGIPVDRRDGRISNGSIEIPEVVKIGEPFTVYLLRQSLKDEEGNEILENGQTIDWIVGGLSTIYTRSQSATTINTKINIAVDVPVYDTETIILNSNNEETTQIVTNEKFEVKTKFIPANSQYMYSDDLRSDLTEEQRRVKRSYYEAVNTDKVTAVYDDVNNMHFVAGDTITTAENGIQINSNTFSKASVQLAKENEIIDITEPEDYHQSMLESLVGNTYTVTSSNTISIGEASIGNFIVANNKVEMRVEQPLRLYLNQYNYQSSSSYLGVNVYSTSGLILDRLLSNMAISFQKDGKDMANGDNKILNVIGGDEEGNYIDIDGMRYYKPNANGSNMRYSYWDISAYDASEITIKVVLLVENQSKIFQVSGQDLVYNVALSITKHEEKALSWANQDELKIMLDYDAQGEIEPYTINLNALTDIPEENIYQDYVFFASFGSEDLSTYVELANKVFGSDGYNLARSGVYSTNSGNLALFAIDRSVINIYEAGSFSLYYATIKTQNGQPIYDNSGLFQIAVMCAGYKRVVSEKALYTSSVAIDKTQINTINFPEQNGETSINQGSEQEFSVIFTIGKESYTVFNDEFQQSFMTPIIKDVVGNDITSYFTVNDGSFEKDEESGEGILTYKFKVKPAVQIDDINGIYFGYLALNYNDRDERNITWEYPIPTSGEEAKRICIYKPQAVSVSLMHTPNETLEELKSPIAVNQTLTTEGVFNTTIKLEGKETPFASVSSFLTAYLGNAEGVNVKILDQKLKHEPLMSQWQFEILEGNSNIISLSEDRKSFVFKDTDSQNANVKLIIKSLDGNATLKYDDAVTDIVFDFVVESVGVTSIRFDQNDKGTYSATLGDHTDQIASATISKYGAKPTLEQENPYIILSNLIEFYIANGVGDEYKYSKAQFYLTPQYILAGALSDEYLLDLYGYDGMLTLYSGAEDETLIDFNEDYSANNIRQTLLSTPIYKIKINKDFATEQTIYLTASDSAGAVNTSISLNLLANIIVSTNNYPLTGEVIYAGEDGGVELINDVTNKNYPSRNGVIGTTLYDRNLTYYIVLNNNRYELVASEEPIEGNKGYLKDGTIKFNDFWDIESQEFRIFFQPEGDNLFAVNQVISFVVNRDLVVSEGTNSTFYILSGSEANITDFAKVTRVTNTEKTPDTEITYDFGGYLEYNGTVKKQENTTFFFDYNQKIIKTKLYVKLNGQTNENCLKVIDVNIELVKSNDIYKDIAKEFNNKYQVAQVQNVGDVSYLLMDMTERVWSFKNDAPLAGKAIKAYQNDFFNNSLRSIYTVNGQTNSITFASQKTLLYGLNDNTKYMHIMFFNDITDSKEEALAVMHLPIILSNVGYQTVRYNSENVTEDRALETALTNPERLLEKLNNDDTKDDVYNEIQAGKLTRILKQYSCEDTITESGLFVINDVSPTLNIYSLSLNKNQVIKNILISKENDKFVGDLTLNHLATSEENVFIAFEYILSKSGNSQVFYYLLKVIPDVVVEDSIYAYDGTSEYLTSSTEDNSTLDLEELFPNTSLHQGYKRFNISKNIDIIEDEDAISIISILGVNVKSQNANLILTYSGKPGEGGVKEVDLTLQQGSHEINLTEKFKDLSVHEYINIFVKNGDVEISYNNDLVFKNLVYTNQVVSVQIGENPPLTSPEEWADKLAITFSGSLMTYRPLINDKMIVTIKRTYPGDENNLAVIGAEQFYTFIINEVSENYSVRFTKDGTEEESTDYQFEIENKEDADKGGKEYKFFINLIKNEMAGSSLNKTIVYDKLEIQATEGSENITSSVYDKSTGAFTFKTKPYINSDKKVIFTLYITQGYLATMTINLKANVTATQNLNEIKGGETLDFDELFDLENRPADIKGYQAIISGDSVYATASENSISVVNLIEDKEITVDYTVTFADDNTFNFTQTYTLKANITPKSSYVDVGVVVAGESHEITLANLVEVEVEGEGDLPADTTIEATSSSSAYKEIVEKKIYTNYVAESVTVELSLKVILYKEQACEQTYNMTYSFNVIPSVEMNPTYPTPNAQLTLPFEYLEEGAVFTDIYTFVNSKPIFGEDTRIVAKSYNGSKYENVVNLGSGQTTKFLSIVVLSKDNASLTIGGNDEVSTNTNIGTGVLKFTRGALNGDSTITFKVTYQQVSQEYTVKIVKNSLTVTLNPVTNNLLTGKNSSDQTVSYERIYVDKTSTEGLFAKHRMVYVSMNDTMSDYADEYYLIFKDADEYYYASKAIYFSATDQSRNLYFDLGTSMADKEFVGAYLASDIEKAGWNVTTGKIIKYKETSTSTEELTAEKLATLTNYQTALFKVVEGKIQLKLANRVQMIYGQYDGKDILVDYDKYGNSIIIKDCDCQPDENGKVNCENKKEHFTFSSALDEIATCDNITPTAFARNDGSSVTHTFTLAYNYMPTLDIAVKEAISSNKNYLEVEVNKEYMSIVSMFGILHPSNNRSVTPANFTTSGDGLTFTIIHEDGTQDYKEYKDIIDLYRKDINSGLDFRAYPTNGTANDIYLFTSGIKNSSGNVCDYAMIPFGAKNLGDFVLGKIVYTAGSFTKEFYVVLKIVPDYQVTYGGSEDNAGSENDGAIVSNIDNPYRLAEMKSETDSTTHETITYYQDFTLAGNDTAYLSIKHKNGTGQKKELSVEDFTITIPTTIVIDSVKYNDEINLKNKLLVENGENRADWNWEDNKVKELKENLTAVTFSNVVEVVFGDQYYMIEGQDVYGYTYRLYFMLKATKQTPVAQNSITINEGGYFDIGVQYEMLSISHESSKDKTYSYHINSVPTTPTESVSNPVPLVVLEGIEAWLFDKDYAYSNDANIIPTPISGTENSDNKEYYLNKNSDSGYTARNNKTDTGGDSDNVHNVSFLEEDQKYLNVPDIKNVSVTAINFYAPNKAEPVLTANYVSGTDKFTAISNWNSFATTGEGFFNGFEPRAPYGLKAYDENGNETGITTNLLHIGTIKDTDVYGSSTSVNLTMLITLKYQKGNNVEYYDCPVNVTVKREISIEEVATAKVQRDGQKFEVADQFSAKIGEDTLNDTTYLNDTLEILVPTNSTISFEMELKRNEKSLKKTSVTLQNNNPFAKTSYISLSQYFGINVNEGDIINISNCNGVDNSNFFYINSIDTTSDTTGKEVVIDLSFTVSKIVYDAIYVENASLLSSTGYYGVTKYYILRTTFNNEEGDSFHYRATRNYLVTGIVYQLQRDYSKEIAFTLKEGGHVVYFKNEDGLNNGWSNGAFTLYQGEVKTASIEVGDVVSVSDVSAYMKYSLDLEKDNNVTLTMGQAAITSEGTITLAGDFTQDQYIKVVIKMGVSGADRNISGEIDDTTYLILDTLNLALERKSQLS